MSAQKDEEENKVKAMSKRMKAEQRKKRRIQLIELDTSCSMLTFTMLCNQQKKKQIYFSSWNGVHTFCGFYSYMRARYIYRV